LCWQMEREWNVTIQAGASWMCAAKYSAGENRSRQMPGAGCQSDTAGRPVRLKHDCSGPDNLLDLRISDYKDRQRCMFPPLGAQTPASQLNSIFPIDVVVHHNCALGGLRLGRRAGIGV
jgi:hypothetical protein